MTINGKRPAKSPRARKQQARMPKAQPVSFGAYPEEIERWKKAAREAQRTLSWWIRNRLLAMDALNELTPAPAGAPSRPGEAAAGQ